MPWISNKAPKSLALVLPKLRGFEVPRRSNEHAKSRLGRGKKTMANGIAGIADRVSPNRKHWSLTQVVNTATSSGSQSHSHRVQPRRNE